MDKYFIVFHKNTALANTLLATKVCENKGNFLLLCDGSEETKNTLQAAVTDFFKGTNYSNYKLHYIKYQEDGNYGIQ